MGYKVLKNVAHNIGHSFLTGLNLDEHYDPVCVQLGRVAIKSRTADFIVDLFTGTIDPPTNLPPTVVKYAQEYVGRLQALLEKHKIPSRLVSSGTIKVHYDLSRLRFHSSGNWEMPYEAYVAIIDDRGVSHSTRFSDYAGSSNIPGTSEGKEEVSPNQAL